MVPYYYHLLQVVTTQLQIPFKSVKVSDIQKEEGRLALFTAAHTSLKIIDHLGLVVNHAHRDDCKIRLHRTKCSNILRNVISPHFIEGLRSDLKNQQYSLLLDESTDIAVHKYLGIVIIYYSNTLKKIVSTFLDLVELEECNADGIVAAIKKTLKKFNLPLENLMGIGTDNAAVMTGINNGVYAKLKSSLPHLILVRCLCHSLQLAVSAAAKEFLPRNLEFIIRETYDWFSKSSARQAQYRNLYKVINENHEPKKIVQACQTRWLSIESAVARIYHQWVELKTHFSISKINERCYTAELLYNMYEDESNYAYISFIYPILMEINRVNKLFEGKDADHTNLFDELMGLIEILVSKITLPSNKINIFTENIQNFIYKKSYLGYRFEAQIEKMRGNGLSENNEELIRGRCIQFVVKLINEIKNRFPENINIMKIIKSISVNESLNHNKRSIIELLEHFGKDQDTIARIDDQWRQLHLLKWAQTTKTKEFWYEVLNFKDSQGQARFQEIASFALSLLVLPHSNADVERVFSSMNLVKSKIRNRMQLPLLCSILTIRAGLRLAEKCCHNYDLPDDVLKKICSNETYQNEINTIESASDTSPSSEE